MVPSRYMCPYCSWKKSCKDNLIRFHIVDKHLEKLMAVRENPEPNPGQNTRFQILIFLILALSLE